MAAKNKATGRALFIPIGFKLIGMVSTILVFSLLGMTYLATSFFSTEIEVTVKLNTRDRAELLAQKIETDLRASVDMGRLIVAAMEGGLVYQGTGKAVTEQLLDQSADLLGVWVVLSQGDTLVVDQESKNDDRISAAGLVWPESSAVLGRHAAALAPAFSGATILDNSSVDFGYPVLSLAFPYRMKNEVEAEAVVVLHFTMEKLIEALTSRELYVNYLVNGDGLLLAHADQVLAASAPGLRNDPIVRDAMTSSSELKQMTFVDTAGQRSIGTYKRFFDGRLTMVSVVNEATALAGVYLNQRRNFLITAMILCASVLILFFFSRSLTLPIRRLVAGSNRIREGDFGVVVSATTRDEIGQLSRSFNDMCLGLAEREKIKVTFGKFVNKEVAERALHGDLQLGGESREAAIFFSDIRSFTAISEKLTPHEVVEFLNDYMTRMVACVNETKGVVDKFIGDAIMAVWGVPSSSGNDTENAINGALLMRRALLEFNVGRGGDKKPIIRIGSGINTGEVIAGQIGSNERMEYTCIGDAVNLASRIESLNKPFQTDLLISQYAHERVQGIFRVEPMKKITVKGKAEPQQIYAVLGRLDDPQCPASLADLRSLLGFHQVNLDELDPDAHEEKFEIVE